MKSDPIFWCVAVSTLGTLLQQGLSNVHDWRTAASLGLSAAVVVAGTVKAYLTQPK